MKGHDTCLSYARGGGLADPPVAENLSCHRQIRRGGKLETYKKEAVHGGDQRSLPRVHYAVYQVR